MWQWKSTYINIMCQRDTWGGHHTWGQDRGRGWREDTGSSLSGSGTHHHLSCKCWSPQYKLSWHNSASSGSRYTYYLTLLATPGARTLISAVYQCFCRLCDRAPGFLVCSPKIFVHQSILMRLVTAVVMFIVHTLKVTYSSSRSHRRLYLEYLKSRSGQKYDTLISIWLICDGSLLKYGTTTLTNIIGK